MKEGEEVKSVLVKDEFMGVAFADAKIGPKGYYLDDSEKALPVSASDLERFMYCPLSWQLAKEGEHLVSEKPLKKVSSSTKKSTVKCLTIRKH